MKRPISFALVMILVAGLLTGMLAGCAKKEPTTIKIGAFFPLTGPVGAQGVYQKQGVELAVEEINAAGGIKGKTVQVVFEDTQGKKENIPTIVRKLIEKDGAVSLVGEVISSNSIAAGPVVKQLKVPAIAPHSTNPAVTKDPEDPSKANPYYFRVIFTDPEQGSALATFAYKELGKTKAAIIFNISQDYNKGLAEFIDKKFKALGGTVAATETYRDGDQDFKTQLTKIKASGAEVIFTPNGYTESGLIVRQAKELGIDVPVIGPNALTVPKFIEIAGAASEGVYISSLFAPDDPDAKAQAFAQKYRTKYNENPNSNSVAAYEAVMLLAEGMKKASKLDPVAIRDAMENLGNVDLPTGTFAFDNKTHNPQGRNLIFLQVQQGKFKFVSRVKPE